MNYISLRFIFLLLIIFIPISIYLLNGKIVFLKVILYVIVIYFLIYKSLEYYYHYFIENNNQLPVEFSSVSYFLIAIGVLFHIKGLREFAGLLAMLSGFFYMLATIVSPESFMHNTKFYLEMARLNHTLLFLTGILVNTIYYNRGYYYPYIFGIILVIVYAYIIKYIYNYSDNSYVIYEITLGSILISSNIYNYLTLIIYYILLVTIYLLLVKFYHKMNIEFYNT